MSLFRSYFSKNSTLIDGNVTNNSQNPVTELFYGTINKQVSRFIFDIDLEPLKEKIESGLINRDNIQKHILNLTNTIRYIPELVGTRFSDHETERVASFTLEIFNINEDWDEGNGYDFVYNDQQFPNLPEQASNWFDRKTNVEWSVAGGGYVSGSTIILGEQSFEDGSENICIDITDYINARLFTGTTGFTATTFGLGIKYIDSIEQLETLRRKSVAFFAKDTNTFYEPYVETTINESIIDDRNYFFLGKDNSLFLYANQGNQPVDVIVNSVSIIDYQDNQITLITGDSIQKVRKGVYKINLNIDPDLYPDSVIFTDRWNIIQNNKQRTIDQNFYLINEDKYFDFNLSNRVNFDNYFFSLIGILDNEKIRRGDIRRIQVDTKQLYPNQNNNLPLDLQYRVYIKQDDNRQIDVIPFSDFNRTSIGYEFLLDTSWLIPQDYFVEIKISNENNFTTMNPLIFTIVSDGTT